MESEQDDDEQADVTKNIKEECHLPFMGFFTPTAMVTIGLTVTHQ